MRQAMSTERRVISDFAASTDALDRVSPYASKMLHKVFVISLFSSYEFTLSEIDALVILSITSLLYILSGVLPALLLVFALKRMTADDENVKKPFVLSTIAIGLYLALLTLDIITVVMLNNAFDSTILVNSGNIMQQPSIGLSAAITFKSVVAAVLAAGVFVLYLIKSLIYKSRAMQSQGEITPQEN